MRVFIEKQLKATLATKKVYFVYIQLWKSQSQQVVSIQITKIFKLGRYFGS